jgi:hypothetical protein
MALPGAADFGVQLEACSNSLDANACFIEAVLYQALYRKAPRVKIIPLAIT